MTLRGRSVPLLIALLVALPAAAQIPEEFENLQVIDSEIERSELISIMRSFTRALGVRCTHCHEGPDDLVGMDFASDELATKRTAREMLEMVRAIESGHLAALPVVEEGSGERRVHVTCYTCHRGMTVPPEESASMLAAIVESSGAREATDRFTELRAEHGDAGRYDLRPVVLFRLAREVMSSGEYDAAIIILDSLHETDPTMGDAYALRAQVEISRGNLEAAETALAKAREVEPEARLANWVEGLLERARTDD